MNAALLEQWSALAESALRAVERGDDAALFASVTRRDPLLAAILADGRPLTAATRRLLDVDREIEAGVRALRDDVARQLSDLRSAREKLRARGDRLHQPALTSRRA